jgi:hypothetical protein
MSKIISLFRKFTQCPAPMDENALRRRVRELEFENQELREKLVWRGPWMF